MTKNDYKAMLSFTLNFEPCSTIKNMSASSPECRKDSERSHTDQVVHNLQGRPAIIVTMLGHMYVHDFLLRC